MRVFLFGDPSSGKTTFLNSLRGDLYNIQYEDFAQGLQKKVYENTFLKQIGFSMYFLYRDFEIWNQSREKNIFFEYSHETTYCFNKTHYKLGKLNRNELKTTNQVLDEISKLLPSNKDDIAIHFVCDYTVISQRLKGRASHRSKKTTEYIDTLRVELENRFKKLCRYQQIDTSNLTVKQVQSEVQKKILPWVKYK